MGGTFTLGIACVVEIIVIVVFWLVFLHYVYKWTKIIASVIVEEHCTVFE